MPSRIKVNVLDHGYVELYDCMGDDLRIVNNARQSFGQESAEFGEREAGLINFLMAHRHGTPFESVVYQFNVKCPIFVAREWFRHRIGSFNEYSGRYSKMINEFYIPEIVRTQTGKPGNYTFDQIDSATEAWFKGELHAQCGNAFILYDNALKAGVAKELARLVLPVNIYTQFTWTVNLRSLFNFVSLRSAANAMYEIRRYSLTIENMIHQTVPSAYAAFVRNGGEAP
jgi:thymidylate synthase (FAD)